MKTVKDYENYVFSEDSFKFSNAGVSLSDKKLDTKPTTFAKDSFKRFCKNKSSVVAAIILGIIILMAIIVPMFAAYDPGTVSANEQYLLPKLFESGTGFWDGTRTYKKTYNIDGSINAQIYDLANETPAGRYKPAVSNLVVDEEPSYVNQASPYGKGGYVMFENQTGITNNPEIAYLRSDFLDVTSDGNYAVNIDFHNVNDIDGSVLGEYCVTLTYFEKVQITNEETGETKTVEQEKQIMLRDWGTNYDDASFDLSQAVATAGFNTLSCKLSIWLKPGEGHFTYVLVKNCVFSANEGVANFKDLEKLGFTDATEMVLRTQDGAGNFPYGYWRCTGRKGMYACEVYYCEFVYDTYIAVYDATEISYAASDMKKLIDEGLCTYDEKVGPESFTVLDDSCPIESVVSQQLNSKTGKLLTLTVRAYRYSTMGYNTMPKFILGTDASGNDVFARMFYSLRTSLILGVCTFIFCFMFGLVWGSISGYFGGWVDLSMERFCDILGGIPTIVVLTLAILHLGNNFFTFVLALCLTGWMGTASGTRTQFYRFKHMEYVLASRTLGSGHLRLIFKHILPNSLGTIVTSSVLMIPSVIFSEATLAYLGLGLQGQASFGVMLSDNQQYISSNPYLIVFPSVIMALLMISFNLFGNGLRDAINPTLKGA